MQYGSSFHYHLLSKVITLRKLYRLCMKSEATDTTIVRVKKC